MNPVRRKLLTLGVGAAAAAAGFAAFGSIAVAETEQDRLTLASVTTPAPSVMGLRPSTPAMTPATLAQDVRRAFLRNMHTGEQLDAVYFENGKYVPDALA